MTAAEFRNCKSNLDRIEAVAIRCYELGTKEHLRITLDALKILHEFKQVEKAKGSRTS